ncbi:type II toxin-antitoxin system ParD family antitoxin [Rhizobium sp.]|uniref:ribbon-helix-helix domain-containing protein n=2 Tax=unclassified Rhizobium TaxID=2613769 RepID=UPI0011B94B4D
MMGRLETISIELTPEMADAVDAAVRSGRFGSTADVVLTALDQWHSDRLVHGYTPEELERLIEEGEASGEPIDGPEAMREIRAKFEREFGLKD